MKGTPGLRRGGAGVWGCCHRGGSRDQEDADPFYIHPSLVPIPVQCPTIYSVRAVWLRVAAKRNRW